MEVLYELGKIIPNWLTAIGTIGTVIVALYLSRKEHKPRALVRTEIKYAEENGVILPIYMEIKIVNTGFVPFTIIGCTMHYTESFYRKRTVDFSIKEPGYQVLNFGEFYEFTVSYGKFENILDSIKKKKLRTNIYFEDTLGNRYKSNKFTIRKNKHSQ